MGHLLHEPLASGCHLSPVLSSGAEPITVPTLCTHARNTEHCVVFVQHLWSLADLHPTRCKQRAQAQKDVSTIYKRINAIHHLSAPSHFCARCVPPTEMPRVDDNGVPRAIPKVLPKLRATDTYEEPHDPACTINARSGPACVLVTTKQPS